MIPNKDLPQLPQLFCRGAPRPACFEGGKHIGKLVTIYQNTLEEHVVKWCPNCGAIVVDSESDNPGKMRFPKNLI